RAVIAADPLRQAVTLKESLKHPAHRDTASVLHCSQLQNVAAIFITHCQRFTAFPRFVIPPAFEVHCPHLVRGLSTPPAAEPASLCRCSRCFRRSVNPARSNTLLKLLSLPASPCSRKSTALTFRRPQ